MELNRCYIRNIGSRGVIRVVDMGYRYVNYRERGQRNVFEAPYNH